MGKGMDISSGEEGPAVLQLHKWRPSEAQLLRNLSEFREGFISPSRELLLLLTYQCEALLLPLVKEKSRNGRDPENNGCEGLENPNPIASRSAECTGTGSRVDTRETSLGTSKTMDVDLTNDSTEEASFLGSSGGSFVCDVNSLAWGVCGDTSNQHEDTSFRELLFVSGNNGITVHAFRKSYGIREVIRQTEEGDNARGTWVEWGPSLDVSHNMEGLEDSRSPDEASGWVSYESRTNESRGTQPTPIGAPKDDLNVGAPKRWLRTFLMKARTLKSDGHLDTRFPESLLFPLSAEIISFSIFSDDLSILEFISHGNLVLHDKESRSISVLDRLNNECSNSDANSMSTSQTVSVSFDSATGGIDSSYRILRVFSSNSYSLVGFAFKITSFNGPGVSEGKQSSIIIAIARLVSWGMQWVCSVKLDDGPGTAQWTDFKLSSSFLICLRKSGLVSFYGAMNGEHIASVDLLHFIGIHPSLTEGLAMKHNGHITNHKKHGLLFHQTGKFAGTRRFRRLLIVSHSSLLGVVDEFGVIYAIPVDDRILGKSNSFEEPLPDHSLLRFGILVGWEVASAEIGCQRDLSGLSGFQTFNNLLKINRSFPSRVNTENREIRAILGSDIKKQSGTFGLCKSGAAQVIDQKKLVSSELSSNFMREIFLPTSRSNEDDVVCFSSFGITRLLRGYNCQENKKFRLVHSNLLVDLASNDDRGNDMQGWESSTMAAIGCDFQGCLYLVTENGLSVVLPSISVSSSFMPLEAIGYRQLSSASGTRIDVDDLLGIERSKRPWSPWKVEILDRVLLYEGPKEADRLCQENGWDLRTSRIRCLQLALYYLKFEEIENSLEMLGAIHLAEEGILRLIFAAVYLMSQKVTYDNDISAASRLLALATSFAIRMVRKYGLLHHKKDLLDQNIRETKNISIPLEEVDNDGCLRRMREMAYFLVIIRDLQLRLNIKFRRPGHGLVDETKALQSIDDDLMEDESKIPILAAEASLLDTANNNESTLPATETAEDMALIPMETSNNETSLVSEGSGLGKRIFNLENPKDMIARWELDNLDLKTIVRDALVAGRLPLAVLKLHLLRSREFVVERETHDTFNEVRDVGRAIAYDLFLKGDTSLAVATLQKLGEDIEASLRQLLFGTLRRSLRLQIAEGMKMHGYLGPHDWNVLERMSLIERVYPCSSFWNAFSSRWNVLKGESCATASDSIHLRVLHPLHKDFIIACGDIDGVVLGSWTSINGHSVPPEVDDDSSHTGYWTAAAVWFDAWDQITIDRVVLDQPFLMGVNILWESQLEYYLGHNDWNQVSMLLELIPSYALSSGALSIRLNSLRSASADEYGQGILNYDNCIYSLDELDGVCTSVPHIKIFRLPANDMCSTWLRMLMEQQLAKKFVFLKDCWESTAEIVSTLARSGFIAALHGTSSLQELNENSTDLVLSIVDATVHPDAVLALHKLLVRFCAQYNLLNLLDMYLDHHKLAGDQESLSLVLDATGDNQWAKWLLLQRVKGKEYEASFCNARAVASHNFLPGNNASVLDADDIMRTVDDIAEGAGEMAALATLIYAPIPIQECLSSGSINRHFSSGQCTLENLRPALQRFPTLWRTLLAACFGQDPSCNMFASRLKVSGYSDLLDYLNWRENIFFSSGRDTSLLQMLPCWFPKAVRRLIQLYVQGPLGWQSIADSPVGESFWQRDSDSLGNSVDHTDISAVSWEAAIQKHIEGELCATSSEETGLGLEHHLHRGRALAAFNHLLALRVQKLNTGKRGPSGTSVPGQTNVQSDVHALLAPITQNEESLLSAVVPLAIVHFEDSVLVTSCALLLELCGLSARILQIGVAALRRISSFYKSDDRRDHAVQLSPKGSALHAKSIEGDITESLARALADDYLHKESPCKQRDFQNNVTRRSPTRALMMVLQHLEKASLPVFADGMTCGSWLVTGRGDGAELRSQQKAASQKWNLVTIFCQIHQMPLSTKYLVCLARDNDWVGFLSEAQVGGYSLDTVIEVASKEFSDPRLKIHILTVLKSIQLRKKVGSSSNSDTAGQQFEASVSDENLFASVELFGIIAECEKLKNPGEALLLKAKNLSWSILAMIAACFPDVSPLSCLAVWLEITAARETSAIKVNDIASQIANNVGAAVEATNSLPPTARALTFHYNRRNQKRRRLIEPILENSMPLTAFDVSTTSGGAKFEGVIGEEEREKKIDEDVNVLSNFDEVVNSLSRMVAVLCEQHLFLPLLKAFEIFLPSCSLLPFLRALQAFSQMRLSESSAHLGSFSARIKEEPFHAQFGREVATGNSWISSIAVKAADAMLSTCPSPYERRCLLQLLAATDFGDDGSSATYYRRLYWKINLAEPSLRKDDGLHLGDETLDDDSLLTALIKNGCWEQARNWARQLEASTGSWRSVIHHVTEMQAESMVAEWKEFLWDVQEERVALWGHCQTLFLRYSFPASQAGLFFLKHAEAAEKDLPARELHGLLLLSLQWLSGTVTQSNQACPLNLLREIETKVWLLAVESEAQMKGEGELPLSNFGREPGTGKGSNIIDHTANIITKIDNHINSLRSKTIERSDLRENNQTHLKTSQVFGDSSFLAATGGNTKTKKRAKGFVPSRRPLVDVVDKGCNESEGVSFPQSLRDDSQLLDDNIKFEASFTRWEEIVGPAELERAILSLLEFGQITAARQLQHKLSPGHIPSEFIVLDAALKLAAHSTPNNKVSVLFLDDEVRSVIQSNNFLADHHVIDPLQVLDGLATILAEGRGRGVCKRIISVVKAAKVLGLSFSEAFDKQPIELLQLLTLKAQDSFEEANLLVQTHSMPAASIAQVLAESFLKGLLAAHRGGYMDSQKEEGPAPLLWRFLDFLKWAELCPSEPEIGHALMRLVITGQEIPHACEVELLILSHHFYKSSACLDGVDVLVALAATRVEAYVSEGDFTCLARLITGVGNFHALNFILGILIENGQLDLLLQKYSAAADANTSTAEAVRGFRMAVLTSLQQFNPHDLDAFAMVYNHFDMKHETAALLESRAEQSSQQWFLRYDKDQTDDLLESMRYFIEAAEVHSSIDAGNKTRKACGQASLVSLQIRMPDLQWLNLSETNARRALVEQSRFQEALVVAEAYSLNQPGEWALVLWNQMLKPELTEQFVAEFVAVLPLQASMLVELARFYRTEVAARGDQSQFSVWLTGGGLPAEWAKYLGRSFRCLLKRTRDLKLRLQMATIATGFGDVIDSCNKALDKVPENAGPLVLRKGHGGAYLPLM